MSSLTLTIRYEEAPFEALSTADRELIEAARRATHTSYAPYSHFSVGAALRLDNGAIVCGSNQENAAFSAGTCAERCALFYAQATYPDARLRAIAVAARGTDGRFLTHPISPCGVCRQALMEARTLAAAPVRTLLYGETGVYIIPDVSDLLPFAFSEIE